MHHLKTKIENYQIYLYFTAILLAIITGLTSTHLIKLLESVIPIFIGILMFSMFSQIPFLKLHKNALSGKFIMALVLSNFILIPILVYCLIQLFNITSPAILIGLMLVLLTPCIDYVIVFTSLGKGNAQYMLISTPILFILQIILLPLYFAIFNSKNTFYFIDLAPFIQSFITFIVLPFVIAALLQYFSKRILIIEKTLKITAWLPEIFMSFVLFTVIASQIHKITHDLSVIATVIPIYILFMLIAPFIGYLSGKLFALETTTLRTLAFSSSTRNALVVLPLALSLPDSWVTVTTTVIITQTLVELIGEVFYIKIIPKFIK
ncbi:arsenic resistance protein [Staphylococcus xylosus]|uniref:arsenic resistance protein n=1 Tax=Staphylococcus xylosus TaxID=1288 RepID=UPI002DBD3D24|nr:bile acid:sodium symporter [Staphylococcus xylosus]MEB8100457.1 bile acid:sodium symporter [Staphylococcus xylosus]